MKAIDLERIVTMRHEFEKVMGSCTAEFKMVLFQ